MHAVHVRQPERRILGMSSAGRPPAKLVPRSHSGLVSGGGGRGDVESGFVSPNVALEKPRESKLSQTKFVKPYHAWLEKKTGYPKQSKKMMVCFVLDFQLVIVVRRTCCTNTKAINFPRC